MRLENKDPFEDDHGKRFIFVIHKLLAIFICPGLRLFTLLHKRSNDRGSALHH